MDKATRLFVQKQDLEKAACELLNAAKEALPWDGEARARYESAIVKIDTLLEGYRHERNEKNLRWES